MVAELLTDEEWHRAHMEKKRNYSRAWVRLNNREDNGKQFCIHCDKHVNDSCKEVHELFNWCVNADWPDEGRYSVCAGCGGRTYNGRCRWIEGKRYCLVCAKDYPNVINSLHRP